MGVLHSYRDGCVHTAFSASRAALGETLADAPLSGLRQVRGRGDQHVAQLGCPDLDGTPARGLAVLPRASSAEVTGYSLDMRVS
jgi:hypothetical protein